MSNKYKDCDEVPNEALCKRLKELSKAVTKGREGLHREFTMRIPAELDRDADLVLSIAARRIESLSQQIDELSQERDSCSTKLDTTVVMLQKKGVQAQKLEDKLTRCSAMFDEVENALAASCRREGKLKEALDEIDDYEADNPPPTAGEKRPATDIQRIIRKAIAQEARQEKVNLPGFQLDDKYPVFKTYEVIDIDTGKIICTLPIIGEGKLPTYRCYIRPVIKAAEDDKYPALAPGPTLKPEEPDLSKCPNCGGPADNGNDRCVPPNAYNCTKCTKSEED